MILSLSASVKSLPYMRRKICPRNCEALSCCLPFCIPDTISFLPESYILLAILNRSEGVRDNNISLYRCSIRV